MQSTDSPNLAAGASTQVEPLLEALRRVQEAHQKKADASQAELAKFAELKASAKAIWDRMYEDEISDYDGITASERKVLVQFYFRARGEKGITEKELEDEIGRGAGSFQVGLRTSKALAATISSYEFMGLGLEGLDSFVDRITSVTREEVNEAIRKYFDLSRAVTVMAGTLKK